MVVEARDAQSERLGDLAQCGAVVAAVGEQAQRHVEDCFAGDRGPLTGSGHVSHPANNPLGVRGVGEGGTLGANAVLAGALADALGIRIGTLPITPARVWKELQ